MAGKRPALLSQASAYYRLAAKEDRAGNHTQAARYRKIGDGRVAQHRRNTDAVARMEGRTGLTPPRRSDSMSDVSTTETTTPPTSAPEDPR